MPIYYPSLVCNFLLRFDEAFHVTEQPAPQSVSAAQDVSVTQGQATIRPLLLSPDVQPPFAPPDRLTIVANRVPITASIELPGYRTAGKFNLQIAYRDLPIDPRLARSCGVEIYIGAVNPSDFATGMVQIEADGSRRSFVRTTTDGGNRNEDALVLVGLVDTWSVKHTSSGSTIDMEGRDLRSIFLDTPADPKLFTKLDLTKPIHKVVEQIIEHHPIAGKMQVVINPDEWVVPAEGPVGQDGAPVFATKTQIPSPGVKDELTAVRRGADGQGSRSTPQGGSGNLNFWDLITRYCSLVGAIPYFVADRLRIRPARAIFDQQKAGFDPAVPTPFADGRRRDDGSGNLFSVRKMVFGRDIAELTFERKYTGVKSRTIEVVSIDTSSKERGEQRLIKARWPAKAPGTQKQKVVAKPSGGTNTTGVSPAGNLATEEVLVIPVAGIRDRDRLREIAKDLYEEIGRGEVGGACQTRSLASFGTDPRDPEAANRDPDLLRLRPGDGVELLFDTRGLSSQAPLVSSLTDTYRRSFEEQVAEVSQRLGRGQSSTGSDDLARVIVASARGAILELQTFFRVANVKYDWSKGGISIAFDYQNYIEARSGVTPSSGANQRPVQSSSAGSPQQRART